MGQACRWSAGQWEEWAEDQDNPTERQQSKSSWQPPFTPGGSMSAVWRLWLFMYMQMCSVHSKDLQGNPKLWVSPNQTGPIPGSGNVLKNIFQAECNRVGPWYITGHFEVRVPKTLPHKTLVLTCKTAGLWKQQHTHAWEWWGNRQTDDGETD